VSATAEGELSAPDGWLKNAAGREYIPAQGRSGVIYRQGEETPEQARARDERDNTKGERPRKKAQPVKGKKPPAPTQVDLKKLEHQLAEGLKMPAMVFAAAPGVPEAERMWAVNHFTKPGLGGADYLARNLVAASEYNPWLREQLERAVSGEAIAVKMITSMSLAAAVFAYAAPPLIVMANLPFPDVGRELLDMPPRRAEAPPAPEPHAESATPTAAAPPPEPVAAPI